MDEGMKIDSRISSLVTSYGGDSPKSIKIHPFFIPDSFVLCAIHYQLSITNSQMKCSVLVIVKPIRFDVSG